jgi:hypothetical protein
VLLTRSRLCPRPKPGSSLHLHVLGTPPAFVLSQDQTLREELLASDCYITHLHKESSGNYNPRVTLVGKTLGLSLVRIRPLRCHAAGMPVAGSSMYTESSKRKTGSILAPSSRLTPRVGDRGATVIEPGHTSIEGRSRMCMLLSFQRPSHLFKEGIPPKGRPGTEVGSRSGPMSIARIRGSSEGPEPRRRPFIGGGA